MVIGQSISFTLKFDFEVLNHLKFDNEKRNRAPITMVLFDLFVYVYVLLHFFNSSLKKKRRASLGPFLFHFSISSLMTNKRSSSHRSPLGPTDGLNVTRRSPRRLRMAPNLRRPLRTNSALCVFDAKSLKIITPTEYN